MARRRPGSRRDAPGVDRARTPTCSTPTTSSPRSSTSAVRVAARQLATARVLQVGGRRLRPDAAGSTSPATGPGLLMLDGLVAFETAVGDRDRSRAARRGRPAAGADPRHRRPARAQLRLARALRPTRFALLDARLRRPGAAVAADRCARCCAGPAAGPPSSTCCGRSPPSRGSRCAWCCCSGTWPRAGAGSSPAAIRLSPAAHPPPARPARRRRAALGLARAQARSRRRGWSPARPTTCTCTGRLEDQLESLLERHAARPARQHRAAQRAGCSRRPASASRVRRRRPARPTAGSPSTSSG